MCDDFNYFLPKYLEPDSLSFVEHMFIVKHLKPKLFPQMIQQLISQIHNPYIIKPLSNKKLILDSDSLFPVVYHYSIYSLQKMAVQINNGKIKFIRIAFINS